MSSICKKSSLVLGSTVWTSFTDSEILTSSFLQTSSNCSFRSETDFLTASKEPCGLTAMLGKSPGPGGAQRD
uniref:Uncharacterized protein n=1 Tax=Anguilla anguilla TaxID=7936 RepID=A0A0E9Y231_ANGAN